MLAAILLLAPAVFASAANRSAGVAHPVEVRGNLLFDAVTGQRFFAKGVAYNPRNGNYGQVIGRHNPGCQPGTPKFKGLEYYQDPASDDMADQFTTYLPLIADLGANVVRLYNIDPEKSHEKFMRQAASLGLTVMVPLTRGDWGFMPASASPKCYYEELPDYGHVGLNLLTSAKLIVDQFSKYDNTFMFVVANEIDHLDRNGFAAYPCIKALTRDIHRYQREKGYRKVPLIYSNKDQGADRAGIAEYLTCELESPDDVVDAFGLNAYSWCDPTYYSPSGEESFTYSPYMSVAREFRSLPKPFLFTEFGCNTGAFQTECPSYKGGRSWTQVGAMMDKMGDFVSGAIAFEFSMENNEYGLVLTPGFLAGQDDLVLTDNYFALKKQFTEGHVSGAGTPRMLPLSQCPSRAAAEELQRRQQVSEVSDWTQLPATPIMPESTVLP
ncbi:unnamed protein product [Effrenium voratum]|nr:unnamed protein product [Effrenium voratum]